MKIAVIGSGYVGLVTGACFADAGNQVTCVDKDKEKIRRLNEGEIPIYEPGLETLVKKSMDQGLLKFTTSTPEAVENSEIIFLAVNTPSSATGEPDLQYLKSAAEEVARALTGYRLIVNKSTVPVGAHEAVANWMKPFTAHAFDVVSNPEFLKEGSAVNDFLKPDRVVIGTHKEEVFGKMEKLYAPFVRQGNPILWMDPISAELTKYACNAFLATRISFMNEMAVLCEKVGGDIESVRMGMSTDVRIGKHFLYAGIGYGGSCFPKDVQAVLATARSKDVPLGIISAAEDANYRQKRHVIQKIKNHFGSSSLGGKHIAIWGLAFKPNTDDIREAPALVMIDELLKMGATVSVFDPVAMDNVKTTFSGKIQFCETSLETVKGADALILATEWNDFRHADFDQIKSLMKSPVFFDGRNMFNPVEVREKGFTYYGIGR